MLDRRAAAAVLALALLAPPASAAAEPVFRAGAFAEDITPAKFPVLVSGGFLLSPVTKHRYNRLPGTAEWGPWEGGGR
jgi:hypothetical protein